MTDSVTLFDKAALLRRFADLGLQPDTYEHPPVFRVDQSDEIKGHLPGAHAKNLFLKDKKGQLWLISAEHDTVVDLKRLPKTIGSDRLSFGSEALLWAHLGVRPGSVTAYALINDTSKQVRFVLDKVLADAEIVNFHPLSNDATTGLRQAAFRTFLASIDVAPIIVDFTTVGADA